jgi:hypothetical protein
MYADRDTDRHASILSLILLASTCTTQIHLPRVYWLYEEEILRGRGGFAASQEGEKWN